MRRRPNPWTTSRPADWVSMSKTQRQAWNRAHYTKVTGSTKPARSFEQRAAARAAKAHRVTTSSPATRLRVAQRARRASVDYDDLHAQHTRASSMSRHKVEALEQEIVKEWIDKLPDGHPLKSWGGYQSVLVALPRYDGSNLPAHLQDVIATVQRMASKTNPRRRRRRR